MKTWKQSTFIGIAVITALALALTACDNGSGTKSDPQCTCPNGTVHTDALCSCDGTDCNCIYQPAIPDPECTCPNGTVHTSTPCACEAEEYNCNCMYAYTETINLDFGGPRTATVKGTLTATQWEGLATKMETAIQNGRDGGSFGEKVNFGAIFNQNLTVIVVEKDASFIQYSVPNCFEVHFDFDYLAEQSIEALAVLFRNNVVPDMCSAPAP